MVAPNPRIVPTPGVDEYPDHLKVMAYSLRAVLEDIRAQVPPEVLRVNVRRLADDLTSHLYAKGLCAQDGGPVSSKAVANG